MGCVLLALVPILNSLANMLPEIGAAPRVRDHARQRGAQAHARTYVLKDRELIAT